MDSKGSATTNILFLNTLAEQACPCRSISRKAIEQIHEYICITGLCLDDADCLIRIAKGESLRSNSE